MLICQASETGRFRELTPHTEVQVQLEAGAVCCHGRVYAS